MRIPPRFGLQLWLVALAGNEPASSFLEVRPLDPAGRQVFVPVRDLEQLVHTIERLREHHECVAVGAAPRVRRAGTADAVEQVWALRADLDTLESVEQLRAFEPVPSIVARSKTPGRLHAYWQLSAALKPEHGRRACLRIAHALGSDPSISDAARVMRAPARFLRLELDAFTAADVVSGLPDPPPPTKPEVVRPLADLAPDSLLAGLARVVRDAEPGSRNERLNWASFRGAEHVAAGQLDEERVRDELLAAAIDGGLPVLEAERTIRSGLGAGIARGGA